jgi:hypothetical protein
MAQGKQHAACQCRANGALGAEPPGTLTGTATAQKSFVAALGAAAIRYGATRFFVFASHSLRAIAPQLARRRTSLLSFVLLA